MLFENEIKFNPGQQKMSYVFSQNVPAKWRFSLFAKIYGY